MVFRKMVLAIAICAAAFSFWGCPNDDDDDDLEFIDFYNPDSECETSIWVYDVVGKETRVSATDGRLYIDDDSCFVENSNVTGLDLFIGGAYVATVRCGYTTDNHCRFFWVKRDDGRHIEITGNCDNGYVFNAVETPYTPCHQ